MNRRAYYDGSPLFDRRGDCFKNDPVAEWVEVKGSRFLRETLSGGMYWGLQSNRRRGVHVPLDFSVHQAGGLDKWMDDTVNRTDIQRATKDSIGMVWWLVIAGNGMTTFCGVCRCLRWLLIKVQVQWYFTSGSLGWLKYLLAGMGFSAYWNERVTMRRSKCVGGVQCALCGF